MREREGSGAYGPAGEMGRRGFVGLGGRKEKKVGRGKKKESGGKDGSRVDRFGLFCFSFFSFLFQIHFKPIFQTIFKSNILHLLKFKFSHKFLQLFFTGFSQTNFNNFSNIFKLLHKFSQTFHNYFKTFP
jgi:hypothetical protein